MSKKNVSKQEAKSKIPQIYGACTTLDIIDIEALRNNTTNLGDLLIPQTTYNEVVDTFLTQSLPQARRELSFEGRERLKELHNDLASALEQNDVSSCSKIVKYLHQNSICQNYVTDSTQDDVVLSTSQLVLSELDALLSDIPVQQKYFQSFLSHIPLSLSQVVENYDASAVLTSHGIEDFAVRHIFGDNQVPEKMTPSFLPLVADIANSNPNAARCDILVEDATSLVDNFIKAARPVVIGQDKKSKTKGGDVLDAWDLLSTPCTSMLCAIEAVVAAAIADNLNIPELITPAIKAAIDGLFEKLNDFRHPLKTDPPASVPAKKLAALLSRLEVVDSLQKRWEEFQPIFASHGVDYVYDCTVEARNALRAATAVHGIVPSAGVGVKVFDEMALLRLTLEQVDAGDGVELLPPAAVSAVNSLRQTEQYQALVDKHARQLVKGVLDADVEARYVEIVSKEPAEQTGSKKSKDSEEEAVSIRFTDADTRRITEEAFKLYSVVEQRLPVVRSQAHRDTLLRLCRSTAEQAVHCAKLAKHIVHMHKLRKETESREKKALEDYKTAQQNAKRARSAEEEAVASTTVLKKSLEKEKSALSKAEEENAALKKELEQLHIKVKEDAENIFVRRVNTSAMDELRAQVASLQDVAQENRRLRREVESHRKLREEIMKEVDTKMKIFDSREQEVKRVQQAVRAELERLEAIKREILEQYDYKQKYERLVEQINAD